VLSLCEVLHLVFVTSSLCVRYCNVYVIPVMNANFVMPIPRTWLFSRSGNSRKMLKTPVTERFSALGVLNDYVLDKSTHSLRVSRRGHVRTSLAPGAGGRDRRCWEERSVLAGTDSGSERPGPATTIVTVAQRAARQPPLLCSRHPARCRTPSERRILNSCRARARLDRRPT